MTERWDEPNGHDLDDEQGLDADDDDLEPGRRPLWVPVVAAIVAVGMIAVAIPRFLWPWIVFFGFVGFLLWRALWPRRP